MFGVYAGAERRGILDATFLGFWPDGSICWFVLGSDKDPVKELMDKLLNRNLFDSCSDVISTWSHGTRPPLLDDSRETRRQRG